MSQEPVEVDYTQPDPLEERLVAYLDGELDDAQAREIEELLATDPKAREILAGLERTWSLLDKLSPGQVDDAFTRTTIEMVSVAAEKFCQDRAALARQLDVLQATLSHNTKYVIPSNADLVTILGLDENAGSQVLPLTRKGRNLPGTPPAATPR